ncbi:MAG TPA: DUF3761 domain-containing protein [Gaiellales bacterium]|nr:DUF3761 domain-containing protein [Gaiellales bacterium]
MNRQYFKENREALKEIVGTVIEYVIGFAILAVILGVLLHFSNTGHHPQQSPAGDPTALCSDGTYSYSAHHEGTCSWHGGVSTWYK